MTTLRITIITMLVAAVTWLAVPANASADWVRTACVTKPSGLLKCVVAFQDADLHRLDVAYALDGVVYWDVTISKGDRHVNGIRRTASLRLAKGLRLDCTQVDSRMECHADGHDTTGNRNASYAIRFYNEVDGEFFNIGGGGA